MKDCQHKNIIDFDSDNEICMDCKEYWPYGERPKADKKGLSSYRFTTVSKAPRPVSLATENEG